MPSERDRNPAGLVFRKRVVSKQFSDGQKQDNQNDYTPELFSDKQQRHIHRPVYKIEHIDVQDKSYRKGRIVQEPPFHRYEHQHERQNHKAKYEIYIQPYAFVPLVIFYFSELHDKSLVRKYNTFVTTFLPFAYRFFRSKTVVSFLRQNFRIIAITLKNQNNEAITHISKKV